MPRILLFLLCCAAWQPSFARAQCVDDSGASCLRSRRVLQGTVDFFATGGTFTLNDDDDDRPDAVLEEGSVLVPRSRIPPRASLVEARLYFGGSLYADDDGRDGPDTEVLLQVPGATEFVPVEAEEVFESGPVEGFPELTLYIAQADVTDAITGDLFGTYRIRGFDADIFNRGVEHTAANASFSLVLVFEEPRLPPRNIVLFDGLQTVLGSTVSLSLDGFMVSPLPSGQLTFYALEGDCHPGPQSCAAGNNLSGLEQIRVRAPGDRTRVLSDAFNPSNDIFNRTINTVEPVLTDVVGTDIDRFDISDLLLPGDDTLTVEVTAPRPTAGERGELIGLAYVVVGIDVFAPELRVDSRIEVRPTGGEGLLFPGDPIDVVVAVSNTGNLGAASVEVETQLPELITGFEVLTPGATVTEDRRVSATLPSVPDGEIASLDLLVQTACPLPTGALLALTATVGSEAVLPFVLSATRTIEASEVCGPRFEVFGGGGCQNTSFTLPAGFLMLLVFSALRAWWARRWNGSAFVVLLTGAGAIGCGTDDEVDQEPPFEIGFTCPGQVGMAAIPSVRGQTPFCIDRYEASLEVVGELGNPVQPVGGDGSTTVVARSQRFTMPARGLTWFQAAAACANAGKSLCSAAQWRAACGGNEDTTYPYGDAFVPARCNGFESRRNDAVPTGGFIEGEVDASGFNFALGCTNDFGVYDLSGNLSEWNADAAVQGTRRGLAGGNYRSNEVGLTCLTDDATEVPSVSDPAYGFRCCTELTLDE
ncbi:MAG: SUMF1/EgtB/PvdO family nonheme iron enzyme [Myxococcota bacterium]